jgi:hypothetical protein
MTNQKDNSVKDERESKTKQKEKWKVTLEILENKTELEYQKNHLQKTWEMQFRNIERKISSPASVEDMMSKHSKLRDRRMRLAPKNTVPRENEAIFNTLGNHANEIQEAVPSSSAPNANFNPN